jgi:hypothetical protein
MSTEAQNPVLILAEAFGRQYVAEREEFAEYRIYYAALLDRTKNPGGPDLKEMFRDLDDRTVRRIVSELRVLIERVGREEQLPNLLSIEEGRSGHQTEELRRRRQTFRVIPNVDLPGFYLRKWWSGVFPNIPGARRLEVKVLYPTVEQPDGRISTGLGDWQIVKNFSRAMMQYGGIRCEDQAACDYTADPEEADTHLILSRSKDPNHVIEQLEFPKSLPLRCSTSEGKISGEGAPTTWQDGEPRVPRSVHVLVSTFQCRFSSARLWIFEAAHDRALEAIARYFANAERLKELAGSLNVGPSDDFPAELQLVFSVQLNRQSQLRGVDGEIKLEYATHRVEPRVDPPVPKPPSKAEVVNIRTATRSA